MKTNLIKEFKEMMSDCGFDRDELIEVINNMQSNEDDFEVANYRFIKADAIDDIQKDELLSDTYILGCFVDHFIAEITGLDIDVIQEGQKAENFEQLGAIMAKHIDEVQSKYVSYDGYGHHFAHYDHCEHMTNDGEYYYFRVN